MNSILGLFLPFGEALSQTVQSLLPKVNTRPLGSKTDPRRLTAKGRALVLSLAKAAVGLGFVNACLASLIPLFAAGVFTTDPGVAAQMASVAPYAMAVLVFHALSTTLEGALFTTGDGAFLGRSYPLNSLVTCSGFFLLRQSHAPLPVLWRLLTAYNVCRVMQFAARILWNQRLTPQPELLPKETKQL